jgi:DNA-binding NarL/FixJ family response regulator
LNTLDAAMERELRILVADDHAIVREGLKTLIGAQTDMRVVAEAADGRGAVDLASMVQPDVAVIDIGLPDLNGVAVVQQLRRSMPQIRTIALTVHEEACYLRQILDAGASGYVLKRVAASELVDAIRSVAAGRAYIDPVMAAKTVDQESVAPRGSTLGDSPLSEREEAVLRLIAQGHSNKEAARRLGLSIKTVETYKARSIEKLGLHSRVDIIRFAMQQGWLTTPDATEME